MHARAGVILAAHANPRRLGSMADLADGSYFYPGVFRGRRQLFYLCRLAYEKMGINLTSIDSFMDDVN